MWREAAGALSQDTDRPTMGGVLDVRLPGRSGLDFLDDLMAQQVKIPAICISGYADVPMSVRAMKAGAREFLLKPIRHQDLIEAIQRVVPLAGAAF
jgi:FixJ family two-component response regulator